MQRAARAAYVGGAARIELCADMAHAGLTPPASHMRAARQAFARPGLLVMIRPRAGDFCYSAREIEWMLRQIELARMAGADGVVLGVLRASDGRVAQRLLRRLRQAASELSVTFHRAFEATPDTAEALEVLIDSGVDRVLTSGLRWGQVGTALEGSARLARLIRQAGQRIEVVVGGGLASAHVPALLRRLPWPCVAARVRERPGERPHLGATRAGAGGRGRSAVHSRGREC